MKGIKFLTLIMLTVFFACQSNRDNDLEALVKKRNQLQKELNKVEEQIGKIDTSHAVVAVPVTIDTVRRGKFEHFIEIQGVVEADRAVNISAEIPAIIKKIHVKEGQMVKAGTLLITLDDETINRKIEELQTQLELANYVYEKQANLRKDNIGSELDFEKAKNKKEYLESALNTARAQKDKARIYAPFDGIVDKIFPREGELAGPQRPLVRFVNLRQMSIKVDVPESYLTSVETGDMVYVSFPELGKTYTSKIARRGNFIEPMNRTFEITINLPGNDNQLLPNLIGVVRIKDLTVTHALMINVDDVMQDAKGNNYVFRVRETEEDTRVEKVFVETGETYKNIQYIKSGLNAGDIIVSQGSRSIVDGQKVRIVQMDDLNGKP